MPIIFGSTQSQARRPLAVEARNIHEPNPGLACGGTALHTGVAPEFGIGAGVMAPQKASREHNREQARPHSYMREVSAFRRPLRQMESLFQSHADAVQRPHGQI